MFQLGMLRSKHDVFGEIVFALDSRQVSWTVVHSLDAPRPVALVELATEFAQWSKLSLILKLEQLGWTEVFAIPAGWTSVPVRQGGVREFWRGAIKNTKWYYIALLMSADIFAKGCTALYHGRKEAYYRSLVKLSREQFVRFGLVDAVDNKYNDDIAEILLLLKDLAPGDELAVEQEAFGDVDDDIYDAITVRAFNHQRRSSPGIMRHKLADVRFTFIMTTTVTKVVDNVLGLCAPMRPTCGASDIGSSIVSILSSIVMPS
jgi:hypothetical protein